MVISILKSVQMFNFTLILLRKKDTFYEGFLVSFLTNRGLLALSAGSFDEAHRHFVAATKLDPYNSVVSSSVHFTENSEKYFAP